MKGRTFFSRWLTGWLLLSFLTVGILGGASLSVRAAPEPASTFDVIINEIAWAGQSGFTSDEWVELYNPGSTTIDLNGWRLAADDGTPNVTLTGTIAPGGYYLIERSSDDLSVFDIPYDDFFTGDIGNNNEILRLYDDLGNEIDVANSDGGAWPAGSASPDYATMERKGVVADSPTAWASNNGIKVNGFAANGTTPIRGTPRQKNSQSYAPLDVVISEIAWAGTKAYFGDEWIELHNPGVTTIQLDGWILTNRSGSLYISFDSGNSIGPGGYFLIERGSGNATSVSEQKTYASELLSDSGDTLYLLDNIRQQIDVANNTGGSWPAGGGTTVSTMERVKKSGVVEPDGFFAWVTNVGSVKNGKDAAGNDIYGTPGQQNWAFTVGPTATPPPPTAVPALTVVINEVAWAGTQSSSDDEWIELYNTGPVDISLNGWALSSSDGSPNINLSGTIKAGKHFLLERTDDDTVANITADLIYTGSLSNTGEALRLYAPGSVLVDTANGNGSYWPAGNSYTYSSMERSLKQTESDYTWVTYDPAKDTLAESSRAVDASGYIIKGTPGRANVQLNVTPTPTPQSSSSGGSSSGSSGIATPDPILGISEFLPRPGHDWNNDGVVDVYDEYIEIINAGSVEVNLGNYRLDDEDNLGSDPFILPGITLKPGERAIFYAAETNILLSDAGDTVRLLEGYSKVVDAYTYGVVRALDQAWCRVPDRLGYWSYPCFPTPGNPNSLTGTFPLPSGPYAGYSPPACLLPDTTPYPFVYAECESSGGGIWNPRYWDEMDDADNLGQSTGFE